MNPTLSPTTALPRTQQVKELIARFIRESELKPGDRLPTERALCERFSVSRTVVREAIKALEASGLVRVRRGSGLYVAESASRRAVRIELSMLSDPEHIESLFEFRLHLESQTAHLAAERITLRELRRLEASQAALEQAASAGDRDGFREADSAFHASVAEASRNPFLAASVAATRDLQNWALDLALARVPGTLTQAAEEHGRILEAIAEGDVEAASTGMRAHIEVAHQAYKLEARRRLRGE